MKYLGVDFGTKRIGLALSDGEGRVAFPHAVLANTQEAMGDIAALATQEEVGQIVVGESRDFSGAPNAVQASIKEFARELGELSGIPVVFEQELFTSALAARQFAPEEKSRKANPSQEKLDAAAAALILQSYLDRQAR